MPNRIEQQSGEQPADQLRVSAIVFAGFHEYDKQFGDRSTLSAIATGVAWESPHKQFKAAVYITTHGVAGRVNLTLTYSGPGRDGPLIAQYKFAHDNTRVDFTCQQIIKDAFVFVGYGTYWYRVLHEGKELAELPVIFGSPPTQGRLGE